MFLHKPRGNNQGSVGRMAAWWNEGKCSGERQNPTVSSEQLLSDLGEPTQSPHRARSGGTCARCTTRTCASNRGCVGWEDRALIVVVTETRMWLVFSVWRPCSNTISNTCRCLLKIWSVQIRTYIFLWLNIFTLTERLAKLRIWHTH